MLLLQTVVTLDTRVLSRQIVASMQVVHYGGKKQLWTVEQRSSCAPVGGRRSPAVCVDAREPSSRGAASRVPPSVLASVLGLAVAARRAARVLGEVLREARVGERVHLRGRLGLGLGLG